MRKGTSFSRVSRLAKTPTASSATSDRTSPNRSSIIPNSTTATVGKNSTRQ
jgi:hypothetical protein